MNSIGAARCGKPGGGCDRRVRTGPVATSAARSTGRSLVARGARTRQSVAVRTAYGVPTGGRPKSGLGRRDSSADLCLDVSVSAVIGRRSVAAGPGTAPETLLETAGRPIPSHSRRVTVSHGLEPVPGGVRHRRIGLSCVVDRRDFPQTPTRTPCRSSCPPGSVSRAGSRNGRQCPRSTRCRDQVRRAP